MALIARDCPKVGSNSQARLVVAGRDWGLVKRFRVVCASAKGGKDVIGFCSVWVGIKLSIITALPKNARAFMDTAA